MARMEERRVLNSSQLHSLRRKRLSLQQEEKREEALFEKILALQERENGLEDMNSGVGFIPLGRLSMDEEAKEEEDESDHHHLVAVVKTTTTTTPTPSLMMHPCSSTSASSGGTDNFISGFLSFSGPSTSSSSAAVYPPPPPPSSLLPSLALAHNGIPLSTDGNPLSADSSFWVTNDGEEEEAGELPPSFLNRDNPHFPINRQQSLIRPTPLKRNSPSISN